MGRAFRKFIYFWVPYIAYTLLIFALAISSIPDSLLTRTGLLSAGVALIALLLLGVNLYYCFRAPTSEEKKEAKFSLILATVMYVLLLILAEIFLPPVGCKSETYDHTRKATRLQLERRNTVVEKGFRGLTIKAPFNDLGWADKPRDYAPGKNQIVLIGDSFLEWKNSRRLSEIMERLLEEDGLEMDVVNLSKDDTDPPQYRHRFQEFALDLKPDHIFLFIYEGNDLQIDYKYEPYQHQSFSLSRKALDILYKLDLNENVKNVFLDLKKERNVFTSKDDLLNKLQGFELSSAEKSLIYLIVYGYSCNDSEEAFIFPKLSSALSNLVKRVLKNIKSLVKFHGIGQSGTYYYPHLHPEYARIFNLPKEERLNAIAKFIGENYLSLNDYHSYLNILEHQDEKFKSYLTEELDDTLYLMTASKWAVGVFNPAQINKPEAKKIEETTGEYVKLFLEMSQLAEVEDIDLTIIFIPEASYGDETFRQFWISMCDFQEYFADKHNLYLTLKQKLSGKVEVIDLGEFPERFSDGYYKFDGHWNDKGNQEVAEIITNHLVKSSIPEK